MSKIKLSETAVQRTLTDALSYAGWLWHWCSDSRRCHGDCGMPDIIATHPSHGLWLFEVKGTGGRLSAAQKRWLAACDRMVIVTPDTLDEVIARITTKHLMAAFPTTKVGA